MSEQMRLLVAGNGKTAIVGVSDSGTSFLCCFKFAAVCRKWPINQLACTDRAKLATQDSPGYFHSGLRLLVDKMIRVLKLN